MKKIVSIILAISLVFSLAACGAKSSPTDVVKKYCDAMKQIDTVTMSACLLNGSDDSADTNLDEEYGDFSGLIEYFKECAAQQKYEILDSSTSNDKGTVTVRFTYVDATNVITETFQAYLQTAFGLALSNADEEAMQKAFLDAFESKKEIIKTGISEVTVVFNCAKTESGWLIDDSPEEISDILSCNASKAFDGIQSAFDGSGSAEAPDSSMSASAPFERDLPEGNYEECGPGTIYVSTPSGTSEGGNVPVLYADANSWLVQIGLNAWDFNGGVLSFIYVDGVLNAKEQLSNTQTSLSLSGNALAEGVHLVEVVQYENDDPAASMTVYKSTQYEVKSK